MFHLQQIYQEYHTMGIHVQSLIEEVFPNALKIVEVQIIKNGNPTCVSNQLPISILLSYQIS